MAENNLAFPCLKCPRQFSSKKGLKMHERFHDPKNEKINDPKYQEKRIANTISVQMHRQRKPKVKFDNLQDDTKAAYREALLFEEFLKTDLDLRVTGIDEKLKDHDDSYKEFVQ